PWRVDCGAGCLAEAQVLVDAQKPELRPLVAGEGRLRGVVVDDLRPADVVGLPAVRDLGGACRDDVLVPRGLLAEGEGHNERIRERAHAEGGRIDAARAPAAVAEDADYRHPPSARDEHHRRVDDPGHEPNRSPGALPKPKAI